MLYVLLPPSEGKAEGGNGRWRETSGTFGRRLGAARDEVVEALGATTLAPTKLGARPGPLLDRVTNANRAVAEHRAKALPAHLRYTGVVWEHLRPATLDAHLRRRILVPSALLGLVTAEDPVPDHRLKFDVPLDGIGRLDRFWRAHLTNTIKHHVRPRDTVVELLPQEHAAAIDLEDVAKRRHVVRTTFAGITGHDAKAVKGALARHLLTHGLDDEPFAWNGWQSATPTSSTDRVIVVSR
ncbi:MAG TPA: peroxide stress protein YaaA [Acidimicrobiales bacterium]|nr:peroxide stress protein YaaA [Acidimicrobiales bacterium]